MVFCREIYSRLVYAFSVLFFLGKKCARANFYTFIMSGFVGTFQLFMKKCFLSPERPEKICHFACFMLTPNLFDIFSSYEMKPQHVLSNEGQALDLWIL